MCVDKLQCHKAAAADEIVDEFVKRGGRGMVQLMVPLYNLARKRIRVD